MRPTQLARLVALVRCLFVSTVVWVLLVWAGFASSSVAIASAHCYDPPSTSTTAPAGVASATSDRDPPPATFSGILGGAAGGFSAAEEGGYPPIAGGAPMLGEGGTQVTSQTLLQTDEFRIDVENPAPGVRPGQLHLQDYNGNKYLYDFETGQFEGLPNSLAKQIANNPAVARAIATGGRYLGVPGG